MRQLIIPSFALERAQEIIFALKTLKANGKLPHIPVYVDSPLTVKLTDVFKLHPECYDEQVAKLLRSHDSPFDFDGLHYVSEVADSMASTLWLGRRSSSRRVACAKQDVCCTTCDVRSRMPRTRVHGEPAAQSVLSDMLRTRNICGDIRVPKQGERYRLERWRKDRAALPVTHNS